MGRHTIDRLEQRHYLRAQTNDFTPSTAWRRHYLWAQSHGHHTCGTSHHRPPGGDTTCRHKAMDITPSTAYKRHYLLTQNQGPVGHHIIDRLQETLLAVTKPWTSCHRPPGTETLPADKKPGTGGMSHHRLPGAQTLPAGTKPGTSHQPPPGGDTTTCGHKAMDITPVGHHTVDRLVERGVKRGMKE